MPVSINDMYQFAYKNEISWTQALLLTGLFYVGTEGLMVSPPPENEIEHHFLKIRLDALNKYPNNNCNYLNVIKILSGYIKNS